MMDKIEFQDKILICRDCSGEFIFTAREQDFFVSKQFHTPTRCKECRIKRKGLQSLIGSNPQRELYEITCAKCGKKNKVPFKPSPEKAVYCNSCYRAVKEEKGNIR